MTKKQKIALAAVPAAALVLAAGTLAVLNSPAAQRNYVVSQLRERGIDARFDEVNFGWIFSDKIELRGAEFTLPHGERLRIDDFSAHHNGLRALFSRKPELRKISCKNATLDDADGRRKFALSARADALGADFSERADAPATFTAPGGCSRRFLANAKNFSVTDAAGRTLVAGTLSGEFAGAEPLALTGTLGGELSALLAQPIFADFNNVAAGAFALNADGNSAEIALAGLRSRAGNSRVHEMKFNLARGENATLALGAEILGAEKRVSRATLDFAELQIGRAGAAFAGTLRAQTLVAEDIAAAFALFRAPEKIFSEIPAETPAVAGTLKAAESEKIAKTAETAKAAETAKTETADAGTPRGAAEISPREEAPRAPAVPFWNGLRGTLDFAVENLVLAENELGAHAGMLEFADSAIVLESSSETFYGGALRNAARLEFSIFPPNYRLAAESVGAGVAVQRFVPALRDAESAALEGNFDFRIQLSAKADVPARLGDAPEIQFFAENSAPGRLRIFEADSKKLRRAGTLVRLGGGLAKMLGGAARNVDARAERFAENVETLEKTLGDFAFTRLALAGEFAAGTLFCRKIELAGDELRLRGNAELRPLADREFSRWPLAVSACTEARGALLRTFADFGIAAENAPQSAGTAEDFAFVRDIEFAGTARKAADDFWKSVRDSAFGR